MATLRKEPWCVLDGSTSPAVMRCKHCHAESSTQLPMDMGMLKKRTDAFLRVHGLCHVPLTKLRARLEEMEEREPRSLSQRTRKRNELRRVKAAMLMRARDHRKKRPEHP